jgi:hypothetical protein
MARATDRARAMVEHGLVPGQGQCSAGAWQGQIKGRAMLGPEQGHDRVRAEPVPG